MKTQLAYTYLLFTCIVMIGLCRPVDVVGQNVDDLVARHIEAKGGLDNLQAIQSLKWTGSSEIMGENIAYTLYQKRPNRVRTKMDMASMGEMTSGYDGETAWSINPMQGGGAQVMPEGQAGQIINQADIDGMLVGYKDKGITLDLVGEEEVQGSNAYKLKVTRANGPDIHLFLDASSYLIVKQESEGQDFQSGGTITIESFLTDYREVDGVMFAFAQETEIGGGQFTWKVEYSDVEVNGEMDDALFAMPKN